jgi:hypothetical protein
MGLQVLCWFPVRFMCELAWSRAVGPQDGQIFGTLFYEFMPEAEIDIHDIFLNFCVFMDVHNAKTVNHIFKEICNERSGKHLRACAMCCWGRRARTGRALQLQEHLRPNERVRLYSFLGVPGPSAAGALAS